MDKVAIDESFFEFEASVSFEIQVGTGTIPVYSMYDEMTDMLIEDPTTWGTWRRDWVSRCVAHSFDERGGWTDLATFYFKDATKAMLFKLTVR